MRRTRFKSGDITNNDSISSELSQSGFVLQWNSGSFVTILRLPYLAIKYGGGSFMLAYFLLIFLIGLPMYIMESSVSQFSSSGALSFWKICPLFKGIGISSIILSIYVIIMYNAFVAYILQYCVYSLWLISVVLSNPRSLVSRRIPWLTCGHNWNSDLCISTKKSINTTGVLNATVPNYLLSSQEYFHKGIQRLSETDRYGQSGVSWNMLMCSLTIWSTMLMLLITDRGQRCTSKMIKKCTLVSVCLMSVLMLKSLTLPGSGRGLLSLLDLSLDDLLDPLLWVDATVQVLFSLSLCSGQVTLNSSYNNFTSNIYRNALLKCLIEVLLSIVVVVTIYSTLGYLTYSSNIGVEKIIQTDIGTSLVLYSHLIENSVASGILTVTVSSLWACLCFGTLLFIGFISLISQTEGVLTNVIDEFNMAFYYKPSLRFSFKSFFCFFIIFFSIPIFTIKGYQLLEIINSHAIGLPRLTIGLLECIVICYVYGFFRFNEDFELMSKGKHKLIFKICLKFVIPILFTLMILSSVVFCIYGDNLQSYRQWMMYIMMQWSIYIVVVGSIPVYCISKSFRYNGSLKDLLKPSRKWSPVCIENKLGRYSRRQTNATSSPCHDTTDWESRNSLPACAVLQPPTTYGIAEMVVHYDAKTGLVNPSYS